MATDDIPISKGTLDRWAETCLSMNHLGTLIKRELADDRECSERAVDLAERARRRAWTLFNELIENGATKPAGYRKPTPKPTFQAGHGTTIQDIAVARKVSELMLEFGARLDSSIRMVAEQCSEDETRAYKRAVGAVLGEMLIAIMNPLYSQHPSLKPPALD